MSLKTVVGGRLVVRSTDIRRKRIMGTTTGMIMRASTILSTATAVVGTRITVIMTTTPRPGDTLMRWSRKSWPGRAGSAACPRSSQSAGDLALARS